MQVLRHRPLPKRPATDHGQRTTDKLAKELLINVSRGEEVRIALMEDERLEELYMERESSATHVGNIYKGKVTNVEASIQAAFVDFGIGRNGFLHVQDLHPQYMGKAGADIRETVGNKLGRRDRPPIQQCLRRGDEILVQIIKEGIGTKGPTLTSYISIPGRFLVMMPGVGKMGVSQKIEDDAERRRLRAILDTLQPPKELGFIIRTAGVGKTKVELERDFKYLVRLWEDIDKKEKASRPPALLYTEGDLVTRTVRDLYTSDIDRIVVDDVDTAKRIKEFFKLSMPRTKNRVDVYEDNVPLFHKYGIEHEIEQMYAREVPLKSGGSLVIDQTEAVVAIDVNSGKFRVHNDAEETAFRTDLEAADEIVRQLRLRDLGGVVICDFIDLRYERHRHALHERLDELFKNDRSKSRFLPMSQFGIIEMTRQRMRPSLKKSVYAECPGCHGSGLVKTPESMGLDIMRRLAIAADDERVVRIELTAHTDVAADLLNRKRRAVADLETHANKRIIIRVDSTIALDELKLELFDERDGLVFLDELKMTAQSRDDRFNRGGRTRGGRSRGGREQVRETEFRLEDEDGFGQEIAEPAAEKSEARNGPGRQRDSRRGRREEPREEREEREEETVGNRAVAEAPDQPFDRSPASSPPNKASAKVGRARAAAAGGGVGGAAGEGVEGPAASRPTSSSSRHAASPPTNPTTTSRPMSTRPWQRLPRPSRSTSTPITRRKRSPTAPSARSPGRPTWAPTGRSSSTNRARPKIPKSRMTPPSPATSCTRPPFAKGPTGMHRRKTRIARAAAGVAGVVAATAVDRARTARPTSSRQSPSGRRLPSRSLTRNLSRNPSRSPRFRLRKSPSSPSRKPTP